MIGAVLPEVLLKAGDKSSGMRRTLNVWGIAHSKN